MTGIQLFGYLPLVMIIVFFVSLPLFYLLMGFDEQINDGDYDDIIKLVIAVILMIISAITYIA